MRFLPAAALISAFGLAGCGASIPLLSEVGLPKIPTPPVLRIEETVDKPTNLIERALSGCDKRIETGEAACVKAALVEQHVSPRALMAMMSPCHPAMVCHMVYTTDDRVGLYAATSSHFIVRWRVDVDFTHPVGSIEAVPITVVQV